MNALTNHALVQHARRPSEQKVILDILDTSDAFKRKYDDAFKRKYDDADWPASVCDHQLDVHKVRFFGLSMIGPWRFKFKAGEKHAYNPSTCNEVNQFTYSSRCHMLVPCKDAYVVVKHTKACSCLLRVLKMVVKRY
jgi:hypothetical protein